MSEYESDDLDQYKEALDAAREFGSLDNIPREIALALSDHIIVTTSIEIAQSKIESELGIVTAECVIGVNILRDLLTEVRDVFGGRSKTIENILRDGRNYVLEDIKIEALLLDADAIVATKFDYQEISGGGKFGMIMIIASGTAVKLIGGRRKIVKQRGKRIASDTAHESGDVSEIVQEGKIKGRDYRKFANGDVEIDTILGTKRFKSIHHAELYLGK